MDEVSTIFSSPAVSQEAFHLTRAIRAVVSLANEIKIKAAVFMLSVPSVDF
jgi:hypothetical protein